MSEIACFQQLPIQATLGSNSPLPLFSQTSCYTDRMASSPASETSGPLFGSGALWAGQAGPVAVSYSLQAYSCESENTRGPIIRVFGHLKPDDCFVEPFEQQMLNPALRPVLRLQDGRTACLRLVWDGGGVLATGHLQQP
jgi:hypothetical protein